MQQRVETTDNSKVKVLVDDERIVRLVTTDMVKNLGREVISVDSGREALASLMEGDEHLDFVRLDYNLPDVDGQVILENLRDKGHKLPGVLISGYELGPDESAGAAAVPSKPFTLERAVNECHAAMHNQP